MKPQFLFFALFCLTSPIFLCCSKEATSKNLQNDLVNENAVSQIMNMPFESEQKSAYRVLNSHEMAFLWVKKFNIVKERQALSKEQKAFIDEMISMIKPELFDHNSQANKDFRSTIVNQISPRAKLLFDYEYAVNLLTSVSISKSGSISTNSDPEDEIGGVGKCKCSTESNYCNNPLAPCDEQPENICRHTRWGCGAFLFFSCNGLCRPA